jgi:GNAT superfamily N-acetyltransferase
LDQTINYRQALDTDVPAMAKIRAKEWGQEEHWKRRISGYMQGTSHPRDALSTRSLFVALANNEVIGFIAGHLTTRLNCTGELQWISVLDAYRGRGIASGLLRLLASWFIQNNATKVCVDPDDTARKFYAKHGASNLNKHWMVWYDIAGILKTE